MIIYSGLDSPITRFIYMSIRTHDSFSMSSAVSFPSLPFCYANKNKNTLIGGIIAFTCLFPRITPEDNNAFLQLFLHIYTPNESEVV